MALRYVVVFRPEEQAGEQDDEVMCKQILLYHAFGNTETTIREKLGQVGIIQAMWSLSGDGVAGMDGLKGEENGDDEEAKVIETEKEMIFTIRVENQYFISLSVSHDSEFAVPNDVYFGHMRNCYYFFRMKYGDFISYNNTKLTDLLNEHFIYFWNDLYLRPDMITSNYFMLRWPTAYKMAEINMSANWETNIIQKILVQDESYLGIKDLLIYHLPEEQQNDGNKKNYGLIRNFSNDFHDISHLSNWIYHLHSVYGRISSHVLAGNVHYQGIHQPDNTEEDENTLLNSETNNSENQPQTFSQNLSEASSNIVHNMILPFTLAYDAIHEVGTTAGVSNSMSLFMDYMPKWSRNYEPVTSNKKIENKSKSRSSFLISPLASNILSESYKVKTLNLRFGKDSRKIFNVLFWYFNDILVVMIFDQDFTKIQEKDYLMKLENVLSESMQLIYSNELTAATDSKVEIDNFAYLVKNKKSAKVYSTFPMVKLPHISDANLYQTTLELVSNTMDQFLSNSNNPSANVDTLNEQKNTGIDIMGNIWNLLPDNNKSSDNNTKLSVLKGSKCFLDKMDVTKLWELVQNCTISLNNLNSQIQNDLLQERLIKTNDGIVIYIREDSDKLVLVLENSIAPESKASLKRLTNLKTGQDLDETNILKSSLFKTLGKDVKIWWFDNYQNFK